MDERDRQVKITIFKFLTDDLKIEMTEESKRYFESHTLSDIALTSTVIVNGYTVNKQCDMIAMTKDLHSLKKNSFFLKYIEKVLSRSYISLNKICIQYTEFLLFYHVDEFKQVNNDMTLFMEKVSDVSLISQTSEVIDQLHTLIHNVQTKTFTTDQINNLVQNEILPLCTSTVPTLIFSYLTLIYEMCQCEDVEEEEDGMDQKKKSSREKKKKRRCLPFCFLCCDDDKKSKKKVNKRFSNTHLDSSGPQTTVVTPLSILTTLFTIPYLYHRTFITPNQPESPVLPQTYPLTSTISPSYPYPELKVVPPIPQPMCHFSDLGNYTVTCPSTYEHRQKETIIDTVWNKIPEVRENIISGTRNAVKHVATSVQDTVGSVQNFVNPLINTFLINIASGVGTAVGAVGTLIGYRVINHVVTPIRTSEIAMTLSGIPQPIIGIVSTSQQLTYIDQLFDLNPSHSYQTTQFRENEKLIKDISVRYGKKLGGSATPVNNMDLRQRRAQYYTTPNARI